MLEQCSSIVCIKWASYRCNATISGRYRKMKKKVIQSCVVFVTLIVLTISNMTPLKDLNAIVMYEGKWKVTKLLTEYFRNRTTFFPHHYFGRTIILEEKSVEQSILEWPHFLEWSKEEYDSSEVVWLPKNDPWVWAYCSWEIDELVESDRVQLIRYLEKGKDESLYCANYFIVLDNTHLVYSSPGGYYLLQPFRYCAPKTSSNDLKGNWEIIYLDSYEDSYVGSFAEIGELKEHIYPNLNEEWNSLKGTDFTADEWLGKTVYISDETLYVSDLSCKIKEVEENRVSRENFEKENGIHDGLSIYDDEINVCKIKCDNGEDVVCVLVNKDNIILHIEQGWFMLNRQQ